MAAPSVADQVAVSGEVKWSAGTSRPQLPLPADAVDCHHHIYDSRFPSDPRATLHPSDATVADYLALKQRLGFSRHVIVQPSTYAFDNSCLLEALDAFGGTARGVVVIDDTTSAEELHRMHAKGIRGARFNLSLPAGAPITIMAALAARIADFGWHVQLVMTPTTILETIGLIRALPTDIVFDHMAKIRDVADPAFGVVADLVQKGKAWVKLSAPYTFADGPDYIQVEPVVRALVKLAPERLLWGTDWPHPTVRDHEKPDDAAILNKFSDWLSTPQARQMVFSENPAKIYDFD